MKKMKNIPRNIPEFTAENSLYHPSRTWWPGRTHGSANKERTVIPQAPPNPPGKTLYLKEPCDHIATDFNVCVYCENPEGTVNCKTYWCQNNGDCQPKPKLGPSNWGHFSMPSLRYANSFA